MVVGVIYIGLKMTSGPNSSLINVTGLFFLVPVT